jgi:phosphoserine phosphatase RsbU/P
VNQSAVASRLLLVDDDEGNRDLLSRQLVRQGHHVLCATGGPDALEKLRKEPIDLILLDVVMPGMDGYEVLDRIKSDPETSDLPVVMVSALDEYNSVIRCIQRGAEDYLLKPFDPILLKSRVKASLEKKELRDQQRRRTTELEEAYQQGVKDSQELFALQRDVTEASRIQKSILPTDFETGRPEYEIYAKMLPAVQMSGDFYDFFPIDEDRIGFVVGDVCGKGIASAFLMAIASTQLRATARECATALECLQYVNQVLVRQNDGDLYVTMFYGILDLPTGEVEFASGGHAAPYILTGDQAHPVPEVSGTMLGLFDDATFGSGKFRLAAGDGLLLYTDGFSEARDPEGKFLSKCHIKGILENIRALSPQEMVRRAMDRVNEFSGPDSRADDVTLMAIRYLGPVVH